MLRNLNIRNMILIDSLDLSFDRGLCVLTGETGTGKSILLDALGCALGWRTNVGMLKDQSIPTSVTAEFEISNEHVSQKMLSENGVSLDDKSLLLRRTIDKTGKSRSYINDQRVTVSFLRQIAETLIEIESQSGNNGVLNAATHMDFLDKYGNYKKHLSSVKQNFHNWKHQTTELNNIQIQLDEIKKNEEYLKHVINELDILKPEKNEESQIDSERSLLKNGHKILDALQEASIQISGESGVIAKLNRAIKVLNRVSDLSTDMTKNYLSGLNQALIEATEAGDQLNSQIQDIDLNPEKLNQLEDRLFALRGASRKHNVNPDQLPKFHENLIKELKSITINEENLLNLKREIDISKSDWDKAAEGLSKKREIAAKKLDNIIAAELPSLKLSQALFKTVIQSFKDDIPRINGKEQIRFTIKTNTGGQSGPLDQLASGGERSRFLLALKVCLADKGDMRSLIFDEIDNGVGGAVADAIGKRLAELVKFQQVIVVTHSPQVAARARKHFVVSKISNKVSTKTLVNVVQGKTRREEIARMLSGASVTEEARTAAESLINGASK